MVKRKIYNYIGRVKSDMVFHIINYSVFFLIALIMLYPFLSVLKDSFTIYKNAGGILIPQFSVDAYLYVLNGNGLLRSFFTTVSVVIAATALHLAVTITAAYPLSRKHFVGRKVFLVYIIITFLFNGGLIPVYLLMKDLGLKNNLLIYILPGATSAYNLVIVKNFFQGIPDSIEESAKMDGASNFIVFLKIFVPLSLPIIAVVALWVAVGKWNDWFTGELYIQKREYLLLQNILRQMLVSESSVNDPTGQGQSDLFALSENIKMAVIVVSTVPVLIIYPFLKKYFIQGVMLGSVKG